MTSSGFEGARTATVNRATLAYREQGEGEPVVFVHGGLSDLRAWEQQLPVLGRSFRAIAYSRRFARPNQDIDPEADDQMRPHVDDLAAFLRGVDAAPAHLVGNSWGAFICLLTAVRHPDLVRTLVLEEPPVLTLFLSTTPPRPAELLRLLASRPRTAIALLGFAARTIAPVQKAFQRGQDDEALRTFVRRVLGDGYFDRLPELRANLSALRARMLGAGLPPLSDDDVRGSARARARPCLRAKGRRAEYRPSRRPLFGAPRAGLQNSLRTTARPLNPPTTGGVDTASRATSSDECAGSAGVRPAPGLRRVSSHVRCWSKRRIPRKRAAADIGHLGTPGSSRRVTQPQSRSRPARPGR